MTATTWIRADWPAPDHIIAGTTTRHEHTFKPSNHHSHFLKDLKLPQSRWIKQVHGNVVVDLAQLESSATAPQADGSYSPDSQHSCVIQTADCLPILICDPNGDEVAALHAGWRGLLQQVIERGIECFKAPAKHLLVWLGPAIGPDAYEVDAPWIEQLLQSDPDYAAILQQRDNSTLADLYALARLQLNRLGIEKIYGGDDCTYHDSAQFYSFRRDATAGRMVSFIGHVQA